MPDAEDPTQGRLPAARHAVLLLALLLLLVVEPQFRGRFGERLLPLAFLLIMLATVLAAGRSRRLFRLAAVIVSIPLLTNVLRLSTYDEPWISIANHLSSAAFLALAATAILSDVFRGPRVTMDKLLGAINVYLLAGVIFAFAFSLATVADPQAFRWPALQVSTAEGSFASHLYFSFVTLTTLGYGDVVPVSETARRLTMLEALFGQLYLAVLIGRLVGLQLSQQQSDTDPKG